MGKSFNRMPLFSSILTLVNTREHVLSTPHVSDIDLIYFYLCIFTVCRIWYICCHAIFCLIYVYVYLFWLSVDRRHAKFSDQCGKIRNANMKFALGLHHYALEVPNCQCQHIILPTIMCFYVFDVIAHCGVLDMRIR